MIEMVRRYLRQKLSSPAILIVMGIFALLSTVPVILSGGSADTGSGTIILIVLAVGSISKDASSGALQMILARPIRRSEYLLGRYLGIAACFALFCILTLALALLIPKVFPYTGSNSPNVVGAAIGLGGAFLQGMLVAAVLLFFSTFLPGYADLLGYVLLVILLKVPMVVAQLLRRPSLGRLGETLEANVQPVVAWDQVFRGVNVFGEATGRYVLALTVFLAAALLVFSRKEFAYGQD